MSETIQAPASPYEYDRQYVYSSEHCIAKIVPCHPFEDIGPALVHAVNAHAEMVEALKAIDDWWTEDFPQGPFAEDLSVWGGVGQLSGETVAIWQKIRTALSKACPAKEGEE